MDTVIKNATVFSDGVEFTGDIGIKDGKIHALGKELALSEGVSVIEANGNYALPGAVDIHLNFIVHPKRRDVPQEVASFTRSALSGGVTTVNLVVPQERSLVSTITRILEKSAFTDYTLTCLLTDALPDLEAGIRSAMTEGGVKLFRIDRGIRGMDSHYSDELLLRSCRAIGRDGLLVISPDIPELQKLMISDMARKGGMKVQNFPSIFPPWMEAAAIEHLVSIVRHTSCSVLIQPVTSALSLDTIRRAKNEGVDIVAGTSLPYLVLSREVYETPDGYLNTCFPPLRDSKDQKSVWSALDEGLLHVVGSNHGVVSAKDKQNAMQDFTKAGWGLPGIAHLLVLVHSEGVEKWKISIRTMTAALCDDPAKLLDIYPKKGSLLPGSDADVVLLDPDKIEEIPEQNPFSSGDFTPYKGLKVKGSVEAVFLRGEIVYQAGVMTREKPCGNLVRPD